MIKLEKKKKKNPGNNDVILNLKSSVWVNQTIMQTETGKHDDQIMCKRRVPTSPLSHPPKERKGKERSLAFIEMYFLHFY